MKKIIAIALAAVMMIAVLAGCGGADSNNDVKLSEVLSEINEKYPDSTSGLTELTEKNDLKRYYGIEVDDVIDFAAEINTDSSKAPLEIVIVKAEDGTAKKEIEQKLTNRYNSILSQYASYSADQLKMAKACGVTTAGDVVVLAVAEDYDGIKSVIDEKLG